MGKKLLITGFDPFGGENINPSWEAVKLLPDKIGDFEITKLQIPTVFGKAAKEVIDAAEELKPDVIICTGQAGGRTAITPEVIGINLREARIADNEGNMPQNEPVITDAPAAYFATLPVRAMVAAINAENIPAALSYSAGAFVCNDVLYTLLHKFDGTDVKAGFIHVPYIPEQPKNGEFAMPLEMIRDGLIHAVLSIGE